MLLDTDLQFLGYIESSIIKEAETVCLKSDWENHKYNRYETTLQEGRLCTLPYAVQTEEQKQYSDDQKVLLNAVMPIVDCISKLFPELLKVRGEIVNIFPGRCIQPHIDIYWFHQHSRRIHVPISTNKDSRLIFENREYHLEQGSVVEINNRIMHSAYNKGKTPRIHLILDLMSVEKVDEAKANKGLLLSKV